jgi:CRISPR-associated endonuclease/helicase Cas3
MAVCLIQDRDSIDITNRYIADENNNITLGVDAMLGYDGVKSNLLDFMKKKHHNITNSKSLTRTPYGALLNQARDPETPIYVSYIPSDLDKTKADGDAIYYAKGINQAIGVIALSELNINS